MLDDIKIPTDSMLASPVVFCRKTNGKRSDDTDAWRFAIGYPKLYAIIQYPQLPIPLIDEILANINYINFTSILYLT